MTRPRIPEILLRAVLLLVLAALPAAAQQPAATRQLSLEEALRLAERQSEAVQIARAGVTRATGAHYQARSQYLPQINATGAYTRTLRSQFSGVSLGSAATDTANPPPPALCAPRIPPNATPAERQAALNAAVTCPAAGGGFNFSKVGFGAPNQWALGLNFSQSVFSGGRVSGQNVAATANLSAAQVELTAQRAQAVLDVTQAYYDAALADQLVTIAESTLVQTADVLRQTRLARQVGNTSEFDLLRAQVTHDNQLPVVIQQRSNRDVAYLRLKQLLNLSLDDSLELTTPLDAATPPTIPVALTTQPAAAPDTITADRAPVRESEANVRAQEGLLRVARAERLPSISIVSGYQRLFFPTSVFPQLSDYRENWTVGASLAVPLFTGGRIRGDELVAEGNLEEARARLQQTRELAALDTRVALNALSQAEASFSASQGTAEQAARAYSIDQIRYREGISTQTDLTQSRLLVEQARANRAQAARDLAVARVRLALLRDLPLQTAGAASAASAASRAAPQSSPTQSQPQQTQTTTNASMTGAPTGGAPAGAVGSGSPTP